MISKKYKDFTNEHYKLKGMCAPDPITISSVIDPSMVTFKPCKIKINKKERTSNITLVEESNI